MNEQGEIITSEFLVSPFLSIGLGYFPLVFSVLFFLIPAIRYFVVKGKNRKRTENILRKKLIGAFVRNHTFNVPLQQIMNLARIESENKSSVQRILERLVIELKGEINIDTSGNPVYSFPRLSSELGLR